MCQTFLYYYCGFLFPPSGWSLGNQERYFWYRVHYYFIFPQLFGLCLILSLCLSFGLIVASCGYLLSSSCFQFPNFQQHHYLYLFNLQLVFAFFYFLGDCSLLSQWVLQLCITINFLNKKKMTMLIEAQYYCQ